MNLREHSTGGWIPNDDKPTIEEINCESLQRIANATELLANNYGILIAERDRYKDLLEHERAKNDHLRHTIAGLRAWITRLRK